MPLGLDTLDEIVYVLDELLLKDQVAFVDLLHPLSVKAEQAVVMSRNSIQAFIDVLNQLIVELDLSRVQLRLLFDE